MNLAKRHRHYVHTCQLDRHQPATTARQVILPITTTKTAHTIACPYCGWVSHTPKAVTK